MFGKIGEIQMNDNISDKTKRKKELDEGQYYKFKFGEIDKRIDELRNRLFELESFKERQAEYIFQSVSIMIGLFTIVFAVLIGIFAPLNLGQYSKGILIALLFYISGILSLWYINSGKRQKREK